MFNQTGRWIHWQNEYLSIQFLKFIFWLCGSTLLTWFTFDCKHENHLIFRLLLNLFISDNFDILFRNKFNLSQLRSFFKNSLIKLSVNNVFQAKSLSLSLSLQKFLKYCSIIYVSHIIEQMTPSQKSLKTRDKSLYQLYA